MKATVVIRSGIRFQRCNSYPVCQQTSLVFQDVFKTLFVFQDVFAIRLPKTSSRRFQDVFKTSSRRVCKTYCNYVFKTSWKTKKCYTEDVFSTSSPKRMFAERYNNYPVCNKVLNLDAWIKSKCFLGLTLHKK